MKKTLLFVFFLLSCNDKKEGVSRQNETLKIIKTLIEQKGLDMVSNYENELPICLNLRKILVNNKCLAKTKEDNKIILLNIPKKTFTNNGEVCIEEIYKSKSIDNGFFLKNDSLDIMNQNHIFKTFKIPKSILGNFKTIEQTEKLKITQKYIQFSIPIFSADNTKAYVQYDHYTNDENSYGNSIYLEKVNDKWKIKHIEANWDN